MEFFVFISEQWLLVSIGLVLIYLLAITEGNKGGKLLSTGEVVVLLNSGDGVLLDVRPHKEFDAGHITDAVNIPHDKLAARLSELDKYKGKTLVVADKLGQHAGAAGKVLRKQGFDVRRIRGGVAEWQNQNLPLVKGKEKIKDKSKDKEKSKSKGKKKAKANA
ncbi:rhodanese-like domain-containing protein [Porticoccus sp. W117]|uniref:rhodanese-like domain-containing protein n=1 Tax=Porticoccus sp. W117 TaxID=3054777 RepID=UPI00338FBB9A